MATILRVYPFAYNGKGVTVDYGPAGVCWDEEYVCKGTSLRYIESRLQEFFGDGAATPSCTQDTVRK